MKDSEFIELLNLYLDHEITAADAGRLEAEVQSNSGRRQVYQQYCRMQKACKMLAVDFQSDVTVGTTGSEKKVVAFESTINQRKPMGGLYAFGAVAAAAACMALILTVRNRPGAVDSVGTLPEQVVVQVPSAPAPAIAISTAPVEEIRVALPTGGLVQRSMLVSDPLLLAGKSQVEGGFATAQANDQLEWIRTLQLAPLQQRVLVEDLRFDVRPATLRPEARSLGASQTPAEAPTEMVVFRFVK